jgi:hypothetical protein
MHPRKRCCEVMYDVNGFDGTVVAVVVFEVDPVTDGLIDAINVMLAEGQWEQVEALAVVLRQHALLGGDEQLAALVEDIRVIALDAVAHPSGDDGVILSDAGGSA